MKSDEKIKVKLEDLRRSLEMIISHLKGQGSEWVEIDEDYYWDVADEQMYNPLEDPTEFQLGQLTHDWERLSEIVKGKAPPIGYALVWLASILRAIGKEHVA
jgi:hypothetical protein